MSLFDTVGGLVAGGTLLVAGCLHLLHQEEFRAALKAQRLIPESAVGVIGFAVATLESLAGILATLYVVWAVQSFKVALLAAAALYWVFAVYSFWLARQHPEAPCGCLSSIAEVVSGLTVARACLLGTLSLLSYMGPALSLGSSSDGFGRILITLLASYATGTLIWLMPSALRAVSEPGTLGLQHAELTR